MNKTCTKCKVNKTLDKFQKNSRYSDGYLTWCNVCKNKSGKKSQIRWALNNPKRVAQIKRAYIERNPDKVLISKRKWSKENSKSELAKCRKYQASKLNAIPKWVTEEQLVEIRNFYKNCPQGYHVDHIVPLQGRNVRGLHVLWNLQYLPAKDNLRKSNKF